MRRVRLVIGTLVVVVMSVGIAACTPQEQAKVGETIVGGIGWIISWWLWILAHPAGSL